MKYLILLFLVGCTTTTAQNSVNPDVQREREIDALIAKTTAAVGLSERNEKAIEDQESKLIVEAVNKIVSLKEEVSTLKIELNEVKATLDSVSNDTGRAFLLLPISGNKEN